MASNRYLCQPQLKPTAQLEVDLATFACQGRPIVDVDQLWDPNFSVPRAPTISAKFDDILCSAKQTIGNVEPAALAHACGARDAEFEAKYQQLVATNDVLVQDGDLEGSREVMGKLMVLLAESAKFYRDEAASIAREMSNGKESAS